jgi:hypothetical protein
MPESLKGVRAGEPTPNQGSCLWEHPVCRKVQYIGLPFREKPGPFDDCLCLGADLFHCQSRDLLESL